MERKTTAPSVDVASLRYWTDTALAKAKEYKALHDEREKAKAAMEEAEKGLSAYFSRLDDIEAELSSGAAGLALKAYADEAGRVESGNQRAAGEYERAEAPNLEAPAPAAELPDKKIVEAFAVDAVPMIEELCHIQDLLAKVDECKAKIAALDAPSAEGADGFSRVASDLLPLLDVEGTWRALSEFVRENNAEWAAYMEKTAATFAERKAKMGIK